MRAGDAQRRQAARAPPASSRRWHSGARPRRGGRRRIAATRTRSSRSRRSRRTRSRRRATSSSAAAVLDVVADDSGLVVDALGGEPGVRSKRWSGRARSGRAASSTHANNALLVAQTARASTDRRARFVCAAAWRGAAGEAVARGEVRGTIARASRRGRMGSATIPTSSSTSSG